jgi:hypothetical protein
MTGCDGPEQDSGRDFQCVG